MARLRNPLARKINPKLPVLATLLVVFNRFPETSFVVCLMKVPRRRRHHEELCRHALFVVSLTPDRQHKKANGHTEAVWPWQALTGSRVVEAMTFPPARLELSLFILFVFLDFVFLFGRCLTLLLLADSQW